MNANLSAVPAGITLDRVPVVSVIVPAYNAEKTLGQTLQSALSQTWPALEVIVVDDGSTDGTADLVRRIASTDDRVRLLSQLNAGVASARNLAIQHASGEFIAPLDADDLWHPRKIELQVEELQKAGPDTGMSYCWSIAINAVGKPMYRYGQEHVEGDAFVELVRRNFIGNASVPLFRRGALDEVGDYRTEFHQRGGQGCEDWDLALRVASRFRVCRVPEYLVKYRHVPTSMSRTHLQMLKSYELLVEALQRSRGGVRPDELRRSRANYLLYITQLQLECRDFRSAAASLLRSLWLDPVRGTHQCSTRAIYRLRRLGANMIHRVAASGTPAATSWEHQCE